MDALFFKVWKNIVIRKEIFKHLLVKHKDKRIFFKNTKQLYISTVRRGEHQGINSIGFTGKHLFINGYNIPDTITSLDIGNRVTDEWDIGDIPSSITELIIGQNYNKPLKHGLVPSSVKTLIIGQRFNQPIFPNDLPESITKLEFKKYSRFNQELITNGLPSGIKELSLSGNFNKTFKQGDIPESITKLSLDYQYNGFFGYIGYLPNSITSLSITSDKLILDNNIGIILKNITSLEINILQNFSILPSSLKKLVLGHCCYQPILPNDLPSTLTHLEFGPYFDHPVDGIFPDSIEYLSFPYSFDRPISSSISKLNNLHTLILGSAFNQLITGKDIPESLATLKYNPRVNQLIQVHEFKSIKNLIFVNGFKKDLNIKFFPPNVTSIDFGTYNKIFKSEDLPSSLIKIKFGDWFSQTLPQLPPLVESIKLGNMFNKSILPNTLPNGLKSIEFGSSYNQLFDPDVLPTSLETIIVGHQFKQDFSKLNLPSSLISFIYPK